MPWSSRINPQATIEFRADCDSNGSVQPVRVALPHFSRAGNNSTGCPSRNPQFCSTQQVLLLLGRQSHRTQPPTLGELIFLPSINVSLSMPNAFFCKVWVIVRDEHNRVNGQLTLFMRRKLSVFSHARRSQNCIGTINILFISTTGKLSVLNCSTDED